MTWRELLTRSYRSIGFGLNEDLEASQITLAQQLCDTAIEGSELEAKYRSFLYKNTYSGAVTNGVLTIGPAQCDITGTIPYSIESILYNDSGYLTPVKQIDIADYVRLGMDDSGQYPIQFAYQRDSNFKGQILFSPQYSGSLDLVLNYYVPFGAIDLDSEVGLPAGYAGYLQYEVARLLAIDYGYTDKMGIVGAEAQRRLDLIKLNNTKGAPQMDINCPFTSDGSNFDFDTRTFR